MPFGFGLRLARVREVRLQPGKKGRAAAAVAARVNARRVRGGMGLLDARGDCPNLIMVGDKRLKGPGEMVIPGDLMNRLNDGHMSQ
jgi:hypothetical protein